VGPNRGDSAATKHQPGALFHRECRSRARPSSFGGGPHWYGAVRHEDTRPALNGGGKARWKRGPAQAPTFDLSVAPLVCEWPWSGPQVDRRRARHGFAHVSSPKCARPARPAPPDGAPPISFSSMPPAVAGMPRPKRHSSCAVPPGPLRRAFAVSQIRSTSSRGPRADADRSQPGVWVLRLAKTPDASPLPLDAVLCRRAPPWLRLARPLGFRRPSLANADLPGPS